MSKIVVDHAELAGIIRESLRETLRSFTGPFAMNQGAELHRKIEELVRHAEPDALGSRTVSVHSLRRALDEHGERSLDADEVLRVLSNNAASIIWASGIEIDFDSATAEDDPSLFVIELRDAWKQLKEG